jgi:hypothetical protein
VLAILAYIVFSNRKKLFPFIHAKDPNTEERY